MFTFDVMYGFAADRVISLLFRVSELLGANIKLETIVSAAVADKLLEVLAVEYFPQFAVIAYISPVSVIRGDKYV